MYSFAQRRDMSVMDEPLFGHFLQHTGVARPSREAVLATMPLDRPAILAQFERPQKPHLFLKHMANHTEGWDEIADFTQHKQVLLTREPSRVLASYQQHIDRPTRLDLCYDHQWRWLNQCQAQGLPVLVVDSDALVTDPESQLKRLCDFLDLPWDANMLHWEPGPRAEDGVWAQYWYQRVHASAGWEGPRIDQPWPEVSDWHPDLQQLLAEVQPVFESLQSHTH
jgi:hypothetical protein